MYMWLDIYIYYTFTSYDIQVFPKWVVVPQKHWSFFSLKDDQLGGFWAASTMVGAVFYGMIHFSAANFAHPRFVEIEKRPHHSRTQIYRMV